MSDPLSDAFRSNIETIRDSMGLSYFAFGKIVTPHEPSQVRTQLTRGFGFSLVTVHRWAERLDIDPLTLLTPGGVQRSQVRRAA